MIWAVGVTLAFICALQYIQLARKNSDPTEKRIILSFGVFFLFYALAFLFWSVSEIFITGSLRGLELYANYINGTPLYEILNKMGGTFFLTGMVLFIATYESLIKKTKYIITFINIPVLVVMIIVPWDLYMILNYFTPTIFLLLFFFINFKTNLHRQNHPPCLSAHFFECVYPCLKQLLTLQTS